MSPLITIVTATYNSNPFIDRLRSSLEVQTFRNFEWICVDDCSRDETVLLVRSFDAPGTGGLKLYCLPHNTGGGVAQAVGIQKASGTVVMLVDHDDELLPHALETVADAWPTAEADANVSGMAFRISDPASGRLIGGELKPGTRFNTSWLMNTRPDIHDLSIAFKREDAQQAFSVEVMEHVALFGWPLTLLTQRKPLVAGPATSIRLYHRDNPNSQTNAPTISRKTVATYAGYMEAWDRHYLRAPLRWLKHGVTLLRYSADVQGSMRSATRLVHRRPLKVALAAMIPVAALVRARRPKPRVLTFKAVDPTIADKLQDLRGAA